MIQSFLLALFFVASEYFFVRAHTVFIDPELRAAFRVVGQPKPGSHNLRLLSYASNTYWRARIVIGSDVASLSRGNILRTFATRTIEEWRSARLTKPERCTLSKSNQMVGHYFETYQGWWAGGLLESYKLRPADYEQRHRGCRFVEILPCCLGPSIQYTIIISLVKNKKYFIYQSIGGQH